MNHIYWLIIYLLLLAPINVVGQDKMDHKSHIDHQMMVDKGGVVMNENRSTLPRDCLEISRDYNLTISAGKDYAADIPGAIFGMSQHEVRVEPCSRVTVTFINEDEVRHQWMIHGLPNYLYPAGMFHIETSGGASRTGTFIVPAAEQTYLIHCDMAQHMEKGMRGQLIVGKGSGDLWAVAGISDQFFRSGYLPEFTPWLVGIIILISFLVSAHLLRKN
jgi:plastocyanin